MITTPFYQKLRSGFASFFAKIMGKDELGDLINDVALTRMDSAVHRTICTFLAEKSPIGVMVYYHKSNYTDEEIYDNIKQHSFRLINVPLYEMVILVDKIEKECGITLKAYTYVQLMQYNPISFVELVKKTYLKQCHA